MQKRNWFKICVLLIMVFLLSGSIAMSVKADADDDNENDAEDAITDIWGYDWTKLREIEKQREKDNYNYAVNDYEESPSDASLIWVVLILAGSVTFGLVMNEVEKQKENDEQQITYIEEEPLPKVRYRPKTKTSLPRRKTIVTPPNRTNEISNLIRQRDERFSAPEFVFYVKKVYMDIQNSWEKRDLKPIQGVMHQNLYQQMQKYVDKNIAEGVINRSEQISIGTCYLTSYMRDLQYEYVDVYLAVRMINYQIKEKTGKLIRGNKSTKWTDYYKLTFMRASEAKTAEAVEKEKDFMCPNCGAPIEGTSFGVCSYCKSMVTVGIHDWVLSDFNEIEETYQENENQSNTQ